jgi:hypothetical protein
VNVERRLGSPLLRAPRAPRPPDRPGLPELSNHPQEQEQPMEPTNPLEPATPTTEPPAGMWADRTDDIEHCIKDCATLLGRIQACASGQFGSRRYVADKAEALRGAAHRLARACHETESWLASCGQAILCPCGADDVFSECTLPPGHAGPHQDVRPAPPLLRLLQVVEELVEAPLAPWTRLAWMSRDPTLVPDCEDLADISAGLDRVQYRLQQASGAEETLRASVTPGGAT